MTPNAASAQPSETRPFFFARFTSPRARCSALCAFPMSRLSFFFAACSRINCSTSSTSASAFSNFASAFAGTGVSVHAGTSRPGGGVVPPPEQWPPVCRFATRCPRVLSHCADQAPGETSVGDGHWAACFAVEQELRR